MTFHITHKSTPYFDKLLLKIQKELNHFFEFNWTRGCPQLFIVPDRKTIDQLKKRKTPDWLVGWSNGTDVFLLDPKKFTSESCHNPSKSAIDQLIKHEVCHSFFHLISNNQIPIWLNEGLAIFISGQLSSKRQITKFQNFLNFFDTHEQPVYQESGDAVRVLIDHFGKPKFLRLIKSLHQVKTKTQFKQLFKSIFGSNPTFTFFNQLLKKTS